MSVSYCMELQCTIVSSWLTLSTAFFGAPFAVCGIAIPGSGEKACGWGLWGHGVVVNMVVLGQQLDFMILEVFSILMIL